MVRLTLTTDETHLDITVAVGIVGGGCGTVVVVRLESSGDGGGDYR